MTQVLSPSDEEIKDFTMRKTVRFRIDDDIFHGVPDIPALDLMKFGSMFDGLTESQVASNPDAFTELFRLVLDASSADVFMSRMGDKTKPIGLGQVMAILPWLMEEYGLRPTQPSSTSSDGSENQDDGTSSTESAPSTAPILELSQPTDS